MENASINDPEFTANQMKLAMRRMASAVCIVSAIDNIGTPHAMTATSISSVSLEPPTLLVCVNRWATIHGAVIENKTFCVNILNNRQKQLAEQCSLKEIDKNLLTQTPWQQDKSGIPYLPDGLACVFCALDRAIEYGTHSIFLGQVTDTLLGGEIEPLLYLDGQYHHQGPALTE